MSIQIKNISKRFGNFIALNNVTLEIKSGELLALLGPSGSGKTTLLRIIAGLEQADSGKIVFDENKSKIENQKSKIRAKRNVGFVFQHYALFKHMSVFDNVAFGLKVRPRKNRPSKEAIHKKVMDLLKLVHLENFHSRYPSQLSGGQRQRVALARALAVEPKVLLLDEPFGALDAKVRKELRSWMRRLHDEINITSVFVTHDQEEAMEVADRVVVMSNGKIEQTGTPEEVYHTPSNSFVYDFLGNYNEFEGWKDAKGKLHLDEYEASKTSPQQLSETGFIQRHKIIGGFFNRLIPGIIPPAKGSTAGKKTAAIKRPDGARPVKIYARPHEMWLTKTPEPEHEYLTTKIIHLNPAGPLVKIEVERQNRKILQIEIPKKAVDEMQLKKGHQVFVRPTAVKVFE